MIREFKNLSCDQLLRAHDSILKELRNRGGLLQVIAKARRDEGPDAADLAPVGDDQ